MLVQLEASGQEMVVRRAAFGQDFKSLVNQINILLQWKF